MATGSAADAGRGFRQDLIVIAVLFALAVILVHPVGNFPLNDDWSFGLAVQRLVETGRYQPSGWVAMPLISNVLLGWLFSKPLGFSFDALRLSTLSISLIGLFYVYWLIRSITHARWQAMCSALTLAFCPIYFSLSHTFMTDVPFTAFMIACATHLWRYLRLHRRSDWLAGTMLAVAACLSRQLGLAVPMAFALTAIGRDARRGQLSAIRTFQAILPCLASYAALRLFDKWLRLTGAMPALYHSKTDELARNLSNAGRLIDVAPANAFLALAYLGLFLLPILSIAACRLTRLRASRFNSYALGGFAVIAMIWLHRWKTSQTVLMPMGVNILDWSGIGPLTLHDASFMARLNASQLPVVIWLVITAMAMVGAGLLLGLFAFWLDSCLRARQSHADKKPDTGAFFWLTSLIYLMPLLPGDVLYDRYLIPVIPLATAAILSLEVRTEPIRSSGTFGVGALAWPLILAYALFSIAATHDYISWNRARWIAIDSLGNDRQALASQLDGGFEFNGYYGYQSDYKPNQQRSWWWVKDDHYMIAFGPIPGWKVQRSIPYPHLLPSRTGAIVVLEKEQPN